MSWIQTLEGKKFDLLNPDPSVISMETLATVLSRKCRFGCHCTAFYSVAQHCVLTTRIVPQHLQLAALLHDAHEAYTGFGDVLRPAKQLAQSQGFDLKAIERRIDAAIAERFDFDVELFYSPEIKKADDRMLATERRDFMRPCEHDWVQLPEPLPKKIFPLTMIAAEHMFLTVFRRLLKHRAK